MRLHITKKNTKIKDTLIFSIPPVKTCPSATELCKSKCYALKFYRVSPKCKEAWEDNLKLSFSPDFAESMIGYIREILTKSRKEFKYFRINDSGDFYNQNYLNAWTDIANDFPQLKFLAYTKSHQLDYSGIPANLKIRYSVFSDSSVIRTDMPLALIDGCDERHKTYHCKPGSKCDACRLCWETDIDIKFTMH